MKINRNDIEGLSRREREKLMRKKEMLAAARQIFAQKGYGETTLEDVAELAEFGKGTLYNYFPNKEALFSSVLEEVMSGFKAIVDEVLARDLGFEEKFRKMIEESLRYAFSNPEGIMLMSRESQHLRDNNPLMQIKLQLVGRLADSIAAEQLKNKGMLQVEAEQLALILMNMIMGQFINRLHLHVFKGVQGAESASEGWFCSPITPDIIQSLTNPANLEEDVEKATELVFSLYFFGITGASQTGRKLYHDKLT
ncbi:MAG: TetR/AcrR family transcriptional regulator [Ignavibacteriae bacterium]|nr:TetR/AcrR family transcriptional regulator [Ignavibacteriota bacterium]MCB9216606.1 TetR/AcrR family transcriptional regulator [Ignavibacteria bacterium]